MLLLLRPDRTGPLIAPCIGRMMICLVPYSLVHPHSAYQSYALLRDNGFIVMRLDIFQRAYQRGQAKKVALEARKDKNKRKREDERTGSSEGQTVTTAASSSIDSSIQFYSMHFLPPAQPKKVRRGALPQRTDEDRSNLEQEIARLREMQSWIGQGPGSKPLVAASTSTHSVAPHSSTTIATSAPSTAADSSNSVTEHAFASNSASASFPSTAPSNTAALYSFLSRPCDFFLCWLPAGQLSASIASTFANSIQLQGALFKKSCPSLPDFILIVTGPTLSLEEYWQGSCWVTRENVGQYQAEKKQYLQGKDPSAYRPTCVADFFDALYTLSDERAAVFGLNPASLSDSVPLLHVRIAVCPLEQPSRVFFIDAPSLDSAPPSDLVLDKFPSSIRSIFDQGANDRGRPVFE